MRAHPKSESTRPRRRERILGTAERLFADFGYDGVSLRQIGTEAGAQIALITYYFGTKEMLYRAVFENRIVPLSEKRRRGLAEAMEAPGGVTIEAILGALARPWIEMRGTEEGRRYTRLIAREASDPREADRGIVRDLLDPIALEFLAAMEQALPERPRADVHWAYHFFVNTLLLVLANPERLARLSGNLIDNSSDDEATERLVGFVARSLAGCGPQRAEPITGGEEP